MKYKGVFPSLYVCCDSDGKISVQRTQALAEYLMKKGIHGLYLCSECIRQTIEERKQILESVLEICKGKITVMTQISASNTADSIALACHAEDMGADAVAVLPPAGFPLPESALCQYWTDIRKATKLDFILCNAPQKTGYHLSVALLEKMMAHPGVIGVKNDSASVIETELFQAYGGRDCIVFDGCDEQFAAGYIMGANAWIGETCGVMPELFLKMHQCLERSEVEPAQQIQKAVNGIIRSMREIKGSQTAVFKEILRLQGLDIGPRRAPLEEVDRLEQDKVKAVFETIHLTTAKYC